MQIGIDWQRKRYRREESSYGNVAGCNRFMTSWPTAQKGGVWRLVWCLYHRTQHHDWTRNPRCAPGHQEIEKSIPVRIVGSARRPGGREMRMKKMAFFQSLFPCLFSMASHISDLCGNSQRAAQGQRPVLGKLGRGPLPPIIHHLLLGPIAQLEDPVASSPFIGVRHSQPGCFSGRLGDGGSSWLPI